MFHFPTILVKQLCACDPDFRSGQLTDRCKKKCLRNMAWWNAIQAEPRTCGNESSEEDDKNKHAAIFEVKSGKKSEGAITDSRERTADTLYNDL